MSEAAGSRPWFRSWKFGWVLFVVTVSGLAWDVSGSVLPGLVVFSSLAACSQLVVSMSSSFRRLDSSREWRPLRYSIGQVMVLAALVAVYLGLLRALLTTYPIEDNGIVLMLSGLFFIIFAIFCALGYWIWICLRNIRAVLRGERLRHWSRVGDREGPPDRP